MLCKSWSARPQPELALQDRLLYCHTQGDCHLCWTPWRTALITELTHNSECKELFGISSLASERVYLGKISKGRKTVNVGGLCMCPCWQAYLCKTYDICCVSYDLYRIFKSPWETCHNNTTALCLWRCHMTDLIGCIRPAVNALHFTAPVTQQTYTRFCAVQHRSIFPIQNDGHFQNKIKLENDVLYMGQRRKWCFKQQKTNEEE